LRPLELTLEGFKSYRKAQTFNFESRTLFGIVGPTGAGKSSILEGLIFGLYGKTPSVESGNKKLINSQDEQARVQLIFEADDVAWEVIRLIRQKGTSQTVLRRLDGVGEPVIGERNVTDRIEEIVGLDFESFRSSVSLPQGEFDRFLKATPTERSRILKGIFRLERVDLLREAAKARWQLIESQIAVLKSILESFPEQPELLLEQLAAEAAEARQLLEVVREELPKVLQAEQDVRHSADQIRRVGQERVQTQTALLRLPPEESLRNLADLHDRAQHRLEEAGDALSRASQTLVEAEAGERAVVIETGGDVWFAAVESALATRQRLDQMFPAAQLESAALEKSFQAGAARLPQVEAAFYAAEATATRAREQLHALEQRHAAHLLRQDLAEGEPCPVCEQPVAAVPESAPLPALSAAKEAVVQAEHDLKASRASFDSAVREQAVAQERLRRAADVVEQRRIELDEVERQLTELAGGSPDSSAELARRRAALATARAALANARAAREAADMDERTARRDLDELAQKARELTNLLSHTCGLLGIGSVSPDEEGLWDASKRVLEAGAARIDELERQTGALQVAARTAVETVESFRTRFGASSEDQASDVLARAKAEVTRLELKIDELKVGIEKRRETEAELAALVERKGRFDRLITDFTDSKFTAFLLDEQRRLLSRIGSEKFHELTGHYTFDDLGNFQIVDQRTGQTRGPETLSGGETFLASLSLALALSEAVALEGGRLGCFFLDEGFGSLDQESLDLALEGIETLTADPGRLIGLISHVAGVQARLEDLIVLERLADGSTEVVQHEGPIGYASALI
jgi:exonuclease SbcC